MGVFAVLFKFGHVQKKNSFQASGSWNLGTESVIDHNLRLYSYVYTFSEIFVDCAWQGW